MKAPFTGLKYKTDIGLIRSVVSWELFCLLVDMSVGVPISRLVCCLVNFSVFCLVVS